MSKSGQVTLTLTAEEARRLERATGEVPYLLNHAARVFELLSSAHASGALDCHEGWPSLFELCGRAFNSAAEKEGEAILMLDGKLRPLLRIGALAELNAAKIKEDMQHAVNQ